MSVQAEGAVERPFETIRLESDGPIVWLTLDRPQVLNAMSGQMRDELLLALDEVSKGPWRCLVMIGAGRCFSSGADLSSFLDEVVASDPDSVRDYMRRWSAVIRGIRSLPVPVVVGLHGPVYGGGMNLALAGDLLIAAADTVLCESYVDIGVAVDLGGSWLLPRLVGAGLARRLLLLGDRIDAAEAERLGLVGEVTEPDRLHEAVRSCAERLASKDPSTVGVIRRLIDQSLESDLDDALEAEARAVSGIVSRPAFQEAVARFRSD